MGVGHKTVCTKREGKKKKFNVIKIEMFNFLRAPTEG